MDIIISADNLTYHQHRRRRKYRTHTFWTSLRVQNNLPPSLSTQISEDAEIADITMSEDNLTYQYRRRRKSMRRLTLQTPL